MGWTAGADWTVSVDGHLDPSALPPLAALTAVWQAVRGLDLGDQQRATLRLLFGTGATEMVEAALDGGVLDFPVVLPDRRIIIRVRRDDGLTGRQRHAARYRVVQEPRRGRNPGLWVVVDTTTGDPVREKGHVLRWGIESSAQSWISREVARGDYQGKAGHAQAS
ncbi:hypothetical protein OG401_20955 [Kitasatospora purpeofusca]|uniref:hypothetical protein n=1 Tax=Kitasatospora purpeofusca TaxID=67352 RepID=UPI00225B0998|nr:hypothetical protein [Kitasatospora purpeofusca]MCX4686750.1 hypothetical protein [Kitasatospora purpeofusca]